MRRALAAILVLFFGLGPLTATLQADEDVRLPACCRRHGAHHCAMAAAMGAQMAARARNSQPALTAPSRCPLYPQHIFTTASSQPAIVPGPCAPAQTGMQHRPIDRVTAVARSQPLSYRAGRSPPQSNPI